MKKEIMAYVTALSDVYSETINQPMIKALNDILNFVEDISTDKLPSTLFELETENKMIKNTNKLLESVCDNLTDNICELVKEKQIISNHNLELVNDLITVKEILSGRRTTK